MVEFTYDGTNFIMSATEGQITDLNASLMLISNSNWHLLDVPIAKSSSYTVPATGWYLFVITNESGTINARISAGSDSASAPTIAQNSEMDQVNRIYYAPLKKGTTLYTRDRGTYTVGGYWSN